MPVGRSRAGLICRQVEAGRCLHVCNRAPVEWFVTSPKPGSTGDFEGCARPSQPTIGIAARRRRRARPG